MILITGINGTLGSELKRIYPDAIGVTKDSPLPDCSGVHVAYLTGGKKGFHECEGDEEAFRRDVDDNIRLIKDLRKAGAFVVFISTEAVERIGHGAAYSRNRLLVEQFLWTMDGCAVVRPARFDKTTAAQVASFCKQIGDWKREGIHYWQ